MVEARRAISDYIFEIPRAEVSGLGRSDGSDLWDMSDM